MRQSNSTVRCIDIPIEELHSITEAVNSSNLPKEIASKINLIIATIEYLYQVIEDKSAAIGRLVRMIFGAATESARNIVGKVKESEKAVPEQAQADKPKIKGHGRNGASAYPGAALVHVNHESLSAGIACPGCVEGKLYEQKAPAPIMRFFGRPPIGASKYELEKLRCNLCGEVFKADLPKEAGQNKYDETVGAVIGVMKYGGGFPFNRIESLQASAGIPMPASTQWWEVVEDAAHRIYPAFEELKRQGAQSDVIYNDDTTGRVLELMKNKEDSERKGVFTTGIVCTGKNDEQKIALFFTGRNHAGENLTEVLKQRNSGLGAPIQMCDALSRNQSKEFETILSNCLVHGRRNFVDVYDNFPEECRYVTERLGKVYKNDETAKERSLSPEERLRFHQAESGPVMEQLHKWMKEQLADKKTEPNSGLGKAIAYMLKHWEKLTRFLEVAGAPLDNNLCERALKKVVLHRKNSLYYKTQCGAYVGDMFMSLIHTCNLNNINPFDYLTELQRNTASVFKTPRDWMPWNYQATLNALPP